MTSVTLKMKSDTIMHMQAYYQSALLNPVPYSIFRAKLPDVTITAYHSGKVLFQGKAAETEAQLWLKDLPLSSQNSQPNNNETFPVNFDQKNLIGSDEVGNGSYFGPLTVCAVYLTNDQQQLVKELGAKDSKKMTDSMIHQIANDLMQTLPYHLTIVNPEKYNHLINQYNANVLKAKLHNFTILKLVEKLNPDQKKQLDGVLIDQFVSEKKYFHYLNNETLVYQENVYFAKRAESLHLSVACASIIARDAFVRGLTKLGASFGGPLPSGASRKIDLRAAKLIDQYGIESLNKTAKLHFANTQKAKELSKNYRQ